MPSRTTTNLVRFGHKVHATCSATLSEEMHLAAQRIKDRAARNTGDLTHDIEVQPPSSGPLVAAGVEVRSDHVAAVEFGTSDQRPQPFIRPEVRESEERLVLAIPKNLRQLNF